MLNKIYRPFGLVVFALLFSACEDQIHVDAVDLISSEVIFGDDDREIVTGTYNKYNRPVGRLRGLALNGRMSNCTATVIGPRHVLTATHCLYNDGTNIQYEDLYFYPGVRAGGEMPFGRFPVQKIYQIDNLNLREFNLAFVENDIAVLEVGPNENGDFFNRLVGIMGFWGRRNLHSSEMKTIGYPTDLSLGAQYMEEGCLVEEFSQNVYQTFCDIMPGQSGSPALFYNEDRGEYYIHGVVSASNPEGNVVTKITPERQRIITSIINGEYEANKSRFSESWVEKNAARRNVLNVLVSNPCSRDAYVALVYLDLQGEWVMDGYFIVSPGETVEMFNTRNEIYRLRVEDSRGRGLISGNHLHTIRGERVGLSEFHSSKKSGDVTHQLSCR